MIEGNEILEGQINIFEVINDFEKPVEKVKRKYIRSKNMSDVLPVPIEKSEWLKMRKEGR